MKDVNIEIIINDSGFDYYSFKFPNGAEYIFNDIDIFFVQNRHHFEDRVPDIFLTMTVEQNLKKKDIDIMFGFRIREIDKEAGYEI